MRQYALYTGILIIGLITILLWTETFVITFGDRTPVSHIIHISGLNDPGTLEIKAQDNHEEITVHPHNLNAPVSVKTHIDQDKIDIALSGLPPLTDIKVGRGQDQASFKTDWAGQFQVNDLAFNSDRTIKEPIKIALYQNGIIDDRTPESSLVVEIFESPNGGGPTSAQVNEYTNSYCGDPVLSVCVEDRMDQQIENVVKNYDTALIMMGEQFSAVQSQYVGIIGSFFDAKQQLETQRTFQRLTAQAHKDYHPSEQLCRFGSFVKSIAKTEEKVAHTQEAINHILMTDYLGAPFASTYEGYHLDAGSRWEQFKKSYCNPADHNNGLDHICEGDIDFNRVNNDIDFSRFVDFPLTIDVDFLDNKRSKAEEDVIALARNLYWFEPLPTPKNKAMYDDQPLYLKTRRLYAMQNIAHNSFAHLVAEKSSAPDAQDSGSAYMKALLREFGLQDGEINKLMGANPSYWAQMDVLSKKIYQSPHFYTHLYDKPVNVERISAALDAVKLMQMRDMHEASLRREMLTSVLIEQGLDKHVLRTNKAIAAKTLTDKFFNRQ